MGEESKPDQISLSKVIYESDREDIINQYIIFCKVFNEKTTQYGMTRKAVTETIRLCKDRNILREYLLSREKEVVSIMMRLFDEEQIMKSFIKSERYEAAQDKVKEKAILMLEKGRISLEEIPIFFPELSDEEIAEIKARVIQLA